MEMTREQIQIVTLTADLRAALAERDSWKKQAEIQAESLKTSQEKVEIVKSAYNGLLESRGRTTTEAYLQESLDLLDRADRLHVFEGSRLHEDIQALLTKLNFTSVGVEGHARKRRDGTGRFNPAAGFLGGALGSCNSE